MERDLGSLILATDISRQNDYLSRFRLHLDQENLCMSTASHRHFVLQVSVGLKKKAPASQQTAGSYLSLLFQCRWPWSVQISVTPADHGSWANSGVRKWQRSSSNKVICPYFSLICFALSFFLFIKVFVTLLQETLRRSTNLKSAHFATERWTQSATFK